MRRLPIRMKLAATLAVPLVALLVMTIVEVRSLSVEADEIAGEIDLARAASGPAGLITLLQAERSWTALELPGQQDLLTLPVEDYDESRRLTDDALAEFEIELAGQGDAALAAYAPALEGLDALEQLRADIDANRASPAHGDIANTDFASGIYQRYTDLVTPIFASTERVLDAIEQPDLRRGAELVNDTSRQITIFVDLARTIVVVPTSQGGFDTMAKARPAIEAIDRFTTGNASLQAAGEPYDQIIADHFPEQFTTDFTTLANRAVANEELEYLDLIAPLEAPGSGGLVEFRMAVADRLDVVADDIHADARSRERLFLVLAGVTLAATLALSWLVSRSITHPLQSLTRQAKAMAEVGLPAAVRDVLQAPPGDGAGAPRAAPVQVETRDEVKDVAEALNSVQDTALDLAVEQAVMRRNFGDSFVNLGRRNQHLIVRQLDFITQLERTETEPETLANLFRLDHLATRMRRNAESLLVLAGVEPPRQWAAPVGLLDVIRAAIGEVEDYQRVAVRDVGPASVVGAAAADLAHLLAELIENALAASAEDRPVTVRGRADAGESYSLAIIDQGVGMDDESLAAANRRLAGAESFTVAPSRHLGHHVAGNLAARHGVRVQLIRSSTGGIAAALELPPTLVTPQAVGPGPTAPHTVDAAPFIPAGATVPPPAPDLR